MEEYWILAFYHFTEVEDPLLAVKRHKKFFENRNVRARIYIASTGINGQFSAPKQEAEDYILWLRSHPCFENVEFKIDPYHEHVLPKVTVKVRQQLVALDKSPDFQKTGTYATPEEWKELMEKRDENTLVLDVRNDYEWEVGHFEGAQLPKLETFRQFPDYAKQLKEEKDPKQTKILMYCTGGIRCELYSALLKEEGFEEVIQLKGGIINYGHKVGSAHWKGRVFVFDDRLCVPIAKEEEGKSCTLISSCSFCATSSDMYYNCANMDCNKLFLACGACAEKQLGCCSEECIRAERRRPYEHQDRPKPFRKWYHYEKE